MNQQEKIQYLANIYHIARADGRIEVAEDNVIIGLIAKDIGAGYYETRKALDLSGEKDFQVKLPDRFSDRVRTIEDMLLTAYADISLDQTEKTIIVDYLRQVGATQDQINIIRKETKSRLQKK